MNYIQEILKIVQQPISTEVIKMMNDDMRRDPNTRSTAAQDQAQGHITQVKGRLKESLGALTGNQRLKAEGQGDQMSGTASLKKGQWKQRIKAWIDRI